MKSASNNLSDLRRLRAEVVALRREVAQWKRRALMDELTGIPNRRHFREMVAHYLLAGRRAGRTFSLVWFDVDGLKRINDRLGHEAGDRALRRFARALRRSARASDFIARWGGDEFVVLLPDTGASGAGAFVARLSSAVTNPPATSGRATARPGDTVSTLLARADRALCAAKRKRRGDA